MQERVKAHVLSTAKKGHVTQCLAVAELLGIEVQEVVQLRGIYKAWPRWRQELDKLTWLVNSVRMAWKFRRGNSLIFSSGRSVLPSTRLIKLLCGDRCFVVHIGSPKHWKTNCADIVLRSQHEREPQRDEENRYPWNPKQVWVSAPICRSLPTTETDDGQVTVLLGGLNISYGDDVDSYAELFAGLDQLVKDEKVNIVFSRRTKPEVVAAVKARYGQSGARLVEADDQDGFLKSCEKAGAFLVTPDSVTMVAEACATGKPVYLADLSVRRRNTRNYRFIQAALKTGEARVFDGSVDFERFPVDRPDIDNAARVIGTAIVAWEMDSSGSTT